MNNKDLKNYLQQITDIELNSEQLDLLLFHVRHVLAWNEKTNLTSITDMQAALVLHVEDSLTALPFVVEAPNGKMADIGSGAGFPGIPLAVASGKNFCLVESRAKKVAALDAFIKEHALESLLKTSNKRAEELAQEEAAGFALITARALSSLSAVMELASPLLQIGGILVAYKGKAEEEELNAASRIESKLGLELVECKRLVLSDKVSQRTLVVFRKASEAKIELPRRAGVAQKRPLQ